MTMSFRQEKFASTLKQSLGEILVKESLNPDFKFVTIARIALSADLKKATLFISTPGPDAEALLEQLRRSAGFIKRRLAKKMILRYMPELDFTLCAPSPFEPGTTVPPAACDHETPNR